jgi:hypothetical protein
LSVCSAHGYHALSPGVWQAVLIYDLEMRHQTAVLALTTFEEA